MRQTKNVHKAQQEAGVRNERVLAQEKSPGRCVTHPGGGQPVYDLRDNVLQRLGKVPKGAWKAALGLKCGGFS